MYKMKVLAPVSDIMTREVVKLNITDDLSKAEELFKKHSIRHIPVMQDNKLVGILSYADLLKVSLADFNEDENFVETVLYNMFSVEQIMTKNVVTVFSFTPIKEVAEILSVHDFRALPVIYENHLVGMVTTTDIMKYLVAQFD